MFFFMCYCLCRGSISVAFSVLGLPPREGTGGVRGRFVIPLEATDNRALDALG